MSGIDDRPESWVFDQRYRTLLEECESEDAMLKRIEGDYKNGAIDRIELDYAIELAAKIAAEKGGMEIPRIQLLYEKYVERLYVKKPNGTPNPPDPGGGDTTPRH